VGPYWGPLGPQKGPKQAQKHRKQGPPNGVFWGPKTGHVGPQKRPKPKQRQGPRPRARAQWGPKVPTEPHHTTFIKPHASGQEHGQNPMGRGPSKAGGTRPRGTVLGPILAPFWARKPKQGQGPRAGGGPDKSQNQPNRTPNTHANQAAFSGHWGQETTKMGSSLGPFGGPEDPRRAPKGPSPPFKGPKRGSTGPQDGAQKGTPNGGPKKPKTEGQKSPGAHPQRRPV